MTEKDHVHEWTVFADGDDVHAACVFPLCHARLLESEIADRLNWYSVEFETPSIPITELGRRLAELLAPTIIKGMDEYARMIQEWNATVHEAGLESDNPKR
jgi:hypothetical protein